MSVSDYKLQAYLLANAEDLIALDQRSEFGQDIFVKKLSDPSKSDLIANTIEVPNSLEFVTTIVDVIRKQLKPKVKLYKSFSFFSEGTEDRREVDIPLSTAVMTQDGTNSRLRRYNLSTPTTTPPGDPGVQIEKVEIVYLGGNPAEIETNIEVKISLFATRFANYFVAQTPSVIEAYKEDTTIPGDIRLQMANGVAWIDLIKTNLSDPSAGSLDPVEQYAIQNGINTVENIRRSMFKSSLASNADQQKIKLEIGYDETLVDSLIRAQKLVKTPDEANAIKEQIKSQTQVYYLNLAQNAINFNSQDGSVEIQVDYIASTGTNTIERKNDLLFDPYLYELELRFNDTICEIRNNIEKTPDNPLTVRLGEGRFGGGVEEVSTVDEKNDAIVKLEANKERLRTLQANKLINGLYGAAITKAREYKNLADSSNNVAVNVTRSRLLFAPKSFVVPRPTGFLRGAVGDGIVKKWGFGAFVINTVERSDEDLSGKQRKEVGDRVQTQRLAIQTAQGAFSLEENLERLIENGFGNNVDSDEVNIEYCYFGDLIETAFEVLASNNRASEGKTDLEPYLEISSYENIVRLVNSSEGEIEGVEGLSDRSLENTEIFVTPFYYGFANGGKPPGRSDPRLKFLYEQYGEVLLGNVTYKNPISPNEEITISLADVPISLIEYKKWFIKTISGVRRRHLFIKNYLESLVNWVTKLIGDAVAQDGSATTNVEPPQIVLNRYFVNAPEYHFLKDSIVDDSIYENRVDIDSLSTYINNNAVSQNLHSKILTSMGQKASRPASQPGNLATDKTLGIPHIIFGQPDLGLLKDINFQREDMPGLRESRLFQGDQLNGFEIIREKYNSVLQLIGTTFFKPGTMFYVDPGPLNVGEAGLTRDPLSPARLLGIGGYYLTIRVTHSLDLNRGTWTTQVDSQWETFGDDTGVTTSKKDEPCITSIQDRVGTATTEADIENKLEEEARAKLVEAAKAAGII